MGNRTTASRTAPDRARSPRAPVATLVETLEPRVLLATVDGYTVIAQAGTGFHSLGAGASINDGGSIAFLARKRRADGSVAENLFAFNASTGHLTQLMNSAFELPNAGDAPNQTFGPNVQINNQGQVLARRLTNTKVMIGFPFGEVLTAPLTYLESWPITGVQTGTGKKGLPDRLVVMGDGGAGPSGPLMTFINPVTAGVYPSPFNQSGGFSGVFADASFNNTGQAAFSALTGGGRVRVTTPHSGGPAYLGGPIGNYTWRPKIADTGDVVLSTGARIYREPFNFSTLQTIAGPETGFTAVGASPAISDDGKILVFTAVHPTRGTGVFASYNTGAGFSAPVKLAGRAGDGALDPGETYVDTNGDGLFNPGEIDAGPITSFDLDAHLGVNRSNARTTTAYTVPFLATAVGGTRSLWTTAIDLPAAPTATHVIDAPLKRLAVGDQITGLRGTVENIDFNDPINNRGQLAFWVALSGGNQAIVRTNLALPAVVNIATHGFGNTFTLDLGIFGTYPGITLFPGFLDGWNHLRSALQRVPEPGSALADNTDTYVANWDSSEGWVQAAFSFLAGAAFTANGNPAAAALAFRDVASHMQRAARTAEAAAQTIVNDVINSGMLGDPALTRDGRQIIHLIGHSRGGAVNARVARLLSDRGYKIDQYTALDGYSTDWPNIGGLLGDIDITAEVNQANVARKVNYRVEDGLVGMVFETLKPFLDTLSLAGLVLGGSPYFTPTIIAQITAQLTDWRAPARPGFENPVLTGYSLSSQYVLPPFDQPRSNHLNVTPLYANSGILSAGQPVLPAAQQYIFDSYLGRHRADPALPDPALPTFAPAASPSPAAPPPAPAAVPPAYRDFYDGAFDALAALYADALATPLPDLDDPAIRTWVGMVRNPALVLASAWDVRGDARIVRSPTGDGEMEMTQTANTSAAQRVLLADNAGTVEFDLQVLAAGPDDVLEVLYGDTLLGAFPLASLTATTARQAVILPDFRPAGGSVTFRIVGPLDAPATIRLDNLAVLSGPRVNTARPVSGTRALEVVFSKDVSATLAVDDLQLRNLSTGATIPPTDLAFAYDPATRTATFTYVGTGGTLPDGHYVATLLADGLTDAVGNALDGDRDGTAGGDFVLHFTHRRADANRDGSVDFNDLVILAQNYGASGKAWSDGDFNDDGQVNFQDLVQLAQAYNTPLPTPLAPSITPDDQDRPTNPARENPDPVLAPPAPPKPAPRATRVATNREYRPA